MVSLRTQLARALREQVFLLVGQKCSRCPATTDLQIHLLVSDGGIHHKFGSDRRWKFYLDKVKAGEALVLCRACHQRVPTARLRRAFRSRDFSATVPRCPELPENPDFEI